MTSHYICKDPQDMPPGKLLDTGIELIDRKLYGSALYYLGFAMQAGKRIKELRTKGLIQTVTVERADNYLRKSRQLFSVAVQKANGSMDSVDALLNRESEGHKGAFEMLCSTFGKEYAFGCPSKITVKLPEIRTAVDPK